MKLATLPNHGPAAAMAKPAISPEAVE